MINRKSNIGSNAVEYIVPLALISLVIGLGIYLITQNQSIYTNILGSSGGKVDAYKSKLAIGTGAASGGIFEDINGNIVLTNNSGKSVLIPRAYYDKYKEDLAKEMAEGKFDFDTTLGTETSGAAGVENIAYVNNSSTKMYSALIDIAAQNSSELTEKKLLEEMSTYGFKLGDIENELIKIQADINEDKNLYKVQKENYLAERTKFETLLAQYESTPPAQITDKQESTLWEAFDNVQTAYDEYSSCVSDYKKASSSYSVEAQSYLNDLKNNTGVEFDNVVNEINQSSKIDQETKDFVVPVGNAISAIKDSVEIINEEVTTIQTSFDLEAKSFTETSDKFKSLNIKVDENAGNETIKKSEEVKNSKSEDNQQQ